MIENGYKRIYSSKLKCRNAGLRIQEHRLVIEKNIGRTLEENNLINNIPII